MQPPSFNKKVARHPAVLRAAPTRCRSQTEAAAKRKLSSRSNETPSDSVLAMGFLRRLKAPLYRGTLESQFLQSYSDLKNQDFGITTYWDV